MDRPLESRLHTVFLVLALVAVFGLGGCLGKSSSQGPADVPPEMWAAGKLMDPGELAKIVSDPQGQKPLVFHVGYQIQYESGHVPGAKYMGTASKPEGIETLKKEAQNIPRDQEIVLYCGCCPFKNCPNVRPAFNAMQEMGFKNVKVLNIPSNFQQDWTNKGYPIEEK